MTRALGTLVVALLAACGDDDAGPRDAGPSTTDAPDRDTSAPDAGPPEQDAGSRPDTGPPDAGPVVPNVREVVHADCPDDGNPTRGGGGGPLHKVTLTDPEAICNDGSPAVMFIRAAANAEFRDRWVFHLQGGGGCASFESCHDRWCSEGGMTLYSAAKMSSRFTGPTISQQGIFVRDPRNPFGDANQVFVYYCSSDTWSGTRNDVVLTSEDGSRSYSMHFRGRDIVEAVLAELLDGVTSDDGVETVPALSAADLVLLTGTSAGQAGVTHNLDYFAGELDGARVLGVFDAGEPFFRDFPAELAEPAETYLRDAHREGRSAAITWGASLDASCLEALGGTDDEFLCFSTPYTKANHITTPFFQRSDLRDSAAIREYLAFGATPAQYAEASRTWLRRLTTIDSTAVEAAAITRRPGVYGPNCEQHVALTNTAWFGIATVEDADGMDVSFGQALARWILGEDVAIIDTHPATLSTCETTTGDLM